MRIVAVVLASLTLAATALADVIVVDGDTLKIDGVTYGLYGVDAPEYAQVCADGLPAGVMASDVLRNLIAGKAVICDARATDRYGRMIGVCRANGLDLGALMVRSGWAWAFIRYSSEYARQEAEARAVKAGVHDHNCQKPWDWRRRQGTGDPSDFPKDSSRWKLKLDMCAEDCGPTRVRISPSERTR